MTSHHLVDPDLLPLLALIPELDFDRVGVAAIRSALAQPVDLGAIGAEAGVDIATVMIPGVGAGTRALLFRPAGGGNDPRPGIVHYHAGGYLIGAPEMAAAANARLASIHDVAILSIDYRLAPEHPFPAAHDDGVAAFRWMTDNAADLGIDPGHIGLMGESAGGGLAGAVALHARDTGGAQPAFLHLLYAMLDDRSCVGENAHTGAFVWTRDHARFAWRALGIDPGSPAVPAYAAPARAERLDGLPPTFLAVGAIDLFAEENLVFAQRLVQAGVPTELHLYPGAFHGFDLMATASVTQALRRDADTWLSRILADVRAGGLPSPA